MTEQEKLRQELTEWAVRQAERDSLVRAAYYSGISKQEIHQRTAIARTTINRIIEGES